MTPTGTQCAIVDVTLRVQPATPEMSRLFFQGETFQRDGKKPLQMTYDPEGVFLFRDPEQPSLIFSLDLGEVTALSYLNVLSALADPTLAASIQQVSA